MNIADSNLINTSRCQGMTNRFKITNCGRYMQEQIEQINVKRQNISTSHECTDQFRFPGCYYAFPGCDRSTSVLKPNKICMESCLHFTKECSAFVRMWNDVFQPSGEEAVFNCVEKPSRNAGSVCIIIGKKVWKRKVSLVGKFSRWHMRRAVGQASIRTGRRLVRWSGVWSDGLH